MSGARSRRKGQVGEREFLGELGGWLGMTLNRNLSQTRDGGRDAELPAPVSLEVKRQETQRIGAWLKQARKQATEGEVPVVAYRSNREPWRVVVEMTVPEFADWLRCTFTFDDINSE